MLEEQSKEIANLKFEHRNERRTASQREYSVQFDRKSAVREIIQEKKKIYASKRSELYSTKIAAKANLLFKQADEQKMLLMATSKEITVLHLKHEQQSFKLVNKQLQQLGAVDILSNSQLFLMRPRFTMHNKEDDDEEEDDDYSSRKSMK